MVGRLINIVLISLLSPLMNIYGQVPVSGPVTSACMAGDKGGVAVNCNGRGKVNVPYKATYGGVLYNCICECNQPPKGNSCTPASSGSSTGGAPRVPSSSNDFKYAMTSLVAQTLINAIFADNSAAEKAKSDKAKAEFEQQKQIDEGIRIAAFNNWKKEQTDAEMKHSIEISQKIKKGELLLEQMHTTGNTGKLEPFSTSSPTLDIQPIGQTSFPTNQLSVFDQLACASYFSNLAMKTTKTEEAAFYSDQASRVMSGQPTYYQCRLPKDNKSEMGQKMDKAKIIYNNFNLKIKDLEGVETKTEEVRQKKEEAVKNTAKAEKDLEELKKEHVSAPPEKKQEMDDLVAKAQDELNKAKEQLKEAEKSEKELDEERKKLEEELNQLKNEMQELKK